MSTNTPLDPVSASAQATATLSVALDAADADSAAAIKNLGLIQQARLSSQTRAATLAVAQYGKDSTQAKAAQSAIAATNTAVARLQLASLQTNTPKPTVAANGWALQGRVLDSSYAPLPRYTVFLVDQQKLFLREYGFAYTDSTGYFLINYAPAAQGEATRNASADSAPYVNINPSALANAVAAPSIFVAVANQKAEHVYLGATAFAPVLGQATTQTIVLAQGEPILGDLPEEIKRVAMPPDAK